MKEKNQMTILIVGASGATGKLAVQHLLDRGARVKAVVRYPEKLPETIRSNTNLALIHRPISEISEKEMVEFVKDCDAVISCLGHNLSIRGILGPPYKLVTNAVTLICRAAEQSKPKKSARFILMNSAGNRNRDLAEPLSLAHRLVLGIMRVLLPPQRDNEKAAEFLRTTTGRNNPAVEWFVVRPDTLINADETSSYSVHPSPIRSAVFDPGQTSRINAAHFMAELATNEKLWTKWRGQMPVVYNDTDSSA